MSSRTNRVTIQCFSSSDVRTRLNNRARIHEHVGRGKFTIDLSRCNQLVIKLDVEQPTVTTDTKLPRDATRRASRSLRDGIQLARRVKIARAIVLCILLQVFTEIESLPSFCRCWKTCFRSARLETCKCH